MCVRAYHKIKMHQVGFKLEINLEIATHTHTQTHVCLLLHFVPFWIFFFFLLYCSRSQMIQRSSACICSHEYWCPVCHFIMCFNLNLKWIYRTRRNPNTLFYLLTNCFLSVFGSCLDLRDIDSIFFLLFFLLFVWVQWKQNNVQIKRGYIAIMSLFFFFFFVFPKERIVYFWHCLELHTSWNINNWKKRIFEKYFVSFEFGSIFKKRHVSGIFLSFFLAS